MTAGHRTGRGTEWGPPVGEPSVRRLHWGCGRVTPVTWINADLADLPGIDVRCDVVAGLPFQDDSIDCITSQHALQDVELYDQWAALGEQRRVLRPGGVLRLCLPDLDRAILAYQTGRRDYFYSNDWQTISGDFIAQVLGWGRAKTLYTYELAEELVLGAGFRSCQRVSYRQTVSPYPEIVVLDDRQNESLFLEAFK